MEMIKVISSNIVAIGHYNDDLYVEFESGTYNLYHDVGYHKYKKCLLKC